MGPPWLSVLGSDTVALVAQLSKVGERGLQRQRLAGPIGGKDLADADWRNDALARGPYSKEVPLGRRLPPLWCTALRVAATRVKVLTSTTTRV